MHIIWPPFHPVGTCRISNQNAESRVGRHVFWYLAGWDDDALEACRHHVAMASGSEEKKGGEESLVLV